MAAKEIETVEKGKEKKKEDDVPENAHVRAHFSDHFKDRLNLLMHVHSDGLYPWDYRSASKYVKDNMEGLVEKRNEVYKHAKRINEMIDESKEWEEFQKGEGDDEDFARARIEIGLNLITKAMYQNVDSWQELLYAFSLQIRAPPERQPDTLRELYSSWFECPKCKHMIDGDETFSDAEKPCPKCNYYDSGEECGGDLFGENGNAEY